MSSATIRVLTLNAHQSFGAHRRGKVLLQIRDGLRTSGADLVFLQEVGIVEGSEVASYQYDKEAIPKPTSRVDCAEVAA